MKLDVWLDAEKGRASAMAAHFKVSISAVSQWRTRPPYTRMREIRSFTGGAVGLDDMVPACPEGGNDGSHSAHAAHSALNPSSDVTVSHGPHCEPAASPRP